MHLLQIYDLYNIERKYLDLLNDKILLNYPFVKYLNASYNPTITNVNHMQNLSELDASCSGINDIGIIKLNLEKLNISRNNKISNLNHMNKLVELDASGCSGIYDNGIKHLNLIKLNVMFNKNITNINHMDKLTELIASGCSGIDDNGSLVCFSKLSNPH
jgi:hypothetical protein